MSSESSTSTAETHSEEAAGEALPSGTPTSAGHMMIGPAVVPADPCAGIEGVHVRLAPGVEPLDLPDLGWGACRPAGRGAWVAEVEVTAVDRAPTEVPDSEPLARGTVRVVYVDGGRRLLAPPEELEVGGEVSAFTRLVPLTLFDLDGDGRHELVVSHRSGMWEETREATMIYTATTGGVAQYEPAAEFASTITEVRDEDGDGRPDLVSLRPFATGTLGGSEGGPAFSGGPALLWHSRPDGTFTFNDDVARSYVTTACANLLGPLFEGYPDLGDGAFELALSERIGCRLLRGNVADAVRASVIAEFPRSRCMSTATAAECEGELTYYGAVVDRVAPRVALLLR